MGFFGSNSTASSNIEDLLREENLPMYDGMSIMEACYAGIAETEMNWNAIMEAAAETEMQYFAEHGEEYVYTEASGFGASVANFFKKIWEKIKGLFKKFLVMIGSLVNNDKDFVKKHRETINRNMKNIPSDAEIKGYKFTNEELVKAIEAAGKSIGDLLGGGNVADNAKTTYKLASDDYDSSEAMESVRGNMLKGVKGNTGDSTMTDSEMRTAAFAICRDGEDSPIDIKIDSARVAEALSHLEGGKKAKDTASKLYSKTEKVFKQSIKDAENIENKAYKAKDDKADGYMKADDLKVLNRAISLAKGAANAIQTLCAVNLQAVKDNYAQDKKICVRVVTYKEVKEGATVEHFAEGTFGRVSLI